MSKALPLARNQDRPKQLPVDQSRPGARQTRLRFIAAPTSRAKPTSATARLLALASGRDLFDPDFAAKTAAPAAAR
jgi:hypothetical protein